MDPRFITFEGIEGSGKSTQVDRLADGLRARGRDPLVTREPGGTALGRALRALLLAPDPEARMRAPLTEALLMVADRHEHVRRVIAPALTAGRIVLCDRHVDSTLAYQGAGSGVDRALLRSLNAMAVEGTRPDRTLLFDLPVATALRRMRERAGRAATDADRFEAETLEFHERVRRAYLAIAAEEPERVVVIDAAPPAEAVAEAVWASLAGWFAATG